MVHLKRMAAPKSWPLPRKKTRFITAASPGPHKKNESIPLNVALRDLLQLTKSTRETKKILNAGKVSVDGIIRKDHRFPVGFFDVISLNEINKDYIMIFNERGKLELKQLDRKIKKPHKIIKKTILKGKRMQLNLFSGKNILVSSGNYKPGDSIIIENNKIEKHLKLEKGQRVFLTGGKHIGVQGVIEDIKEDKKNEGVIIVKADKGVFETLKEYAFIIGDKL